MLELALIVVPLLLSGAFVWWDRRRRRDHTWVSVTPGERPVRDRSGSDGSRVRPVGAAGDDTVTVRFTPPDKMTPGMAGTIIDGRADGRDVAATVVDLAVRGYLRFHVRTLAGDTGARRTVWRITRQRTRIGGLERHERSIMEAFRARKSPSSPDDLPQGMLANARTALRLDAVEHGWFREHLKPTTRGFALIVALIALIPVTEALTVGSAWGLAAAVGLVGSALLLAAFPSPPASRTPAGRATQMQALGFQRYLATAEAGQIRLEEAHDVFSRFLPWAIAFGVTDRWTATFAEAAAREGAQGIRAAFDLHWIEGLELLGPDTTNLHRLTGEAFDALEGESALSEALASISEGVGAFFDATTLGPNS